MQLQYQKREIDPSKYCIISWRKMGSSISTEDLETLLYNDTSNLSMELQSHLWKTSRIKLFYLNFR